MQKLAKVFSLALVVGICFMPPKVLSASDKPARQWEKELDRVDSPMTFLTQDSPAIPSRRVSSCQDIGSGGCGGYNKDSKRNCGPCERIHTYKCDDGSYQEACIADRACGSNCH
jgi:hypothetical protein